MSIPARPDVPKTFILPLPETVSYHEGYFQITGDTVIVADNQTQPVASLLASWLAPASGFTPAILTEATDNVSTIYLKIDTALTHLGQEGYALDVTPQHITIRGASSAGVFYAVQTFRQLLPVEIFAETVVQSEWRIPSVAIEDHPRFSWRGLMLDTARHFIPKAEIFKFIDLLALHKMNVLHLHLTDDQGWRVEIKKYPGLTEVGSQRKETIVGHARKSQGYDGIPHGGFYSQEDLREIVAYASARFITIVPEVDIPGHAMSAIAAYPEFGVTGKSIEVGTTWGIFPYLYSPTEEALQFLRDVFTEIMDIFPGRYIHVGGDEAIKDQWKASESVQVRIKELGLKDEEELQSWFLSQIGMFLAQNGRRLVGWDEILHGGLPPGATVMSWRGIEGGIAAAQAQHDFVMSSCTNLYFDYYQSNDPAEPQGIGGYLPLDVVYGFDPVPAALTVEQARYMLGTQCQLWTEYVKTTDHLEYMLFPRMIAVAEMGWTPQQQREFPDFCQRLAVHEGRLERLNVNFRSVAKLEQEKQFPQRKSHYSNA